jgi:hypothetical protein
MYEALGSVLRELVANQLAFQEQGKVVGKTHGPLRMDAKHVAAADVAIERLRRPHLAGRPIRTEPEVKSSEPSVDGGEPVDILAQAMGIAAE